ncbi:hypothetical protein [uncultured Jatrophihabitans sp.]|uniref:hypothetical protein n=1 Tax=uncultured Jatrophihabitans sp. TaxID=1610747 RepID=UPI0035CA91CE
MTRTTARLGAAAAALAVLVSAAACSSSGGSGRTSTPTSTAATHTVTASRTPPSSAASASSAPSGGSSSAAAGPGPAAVHQKLTNFRVVDVTYVGSQAWALGSANCLSGHGTCDAVEYSGDGGRTWRSAPAPEAGITSSAGTCLHTCVQHIRFATSRVGYSYGHGTFFTTSDGGSTWVRRSGQAEALESLDGNVIRVRTDTSACPPGCTYYVETAAIGSTHWHRVSLGSPEGDGMSLVRSGAESYLLMNQNPAGGAEHATSTLWSSSDNGQSWTRHGEVCPQAGGEVDGALLSSAPDGAVAVLCRPRIGKRSSFVVVSAAGGAHFRAASTTALGAAGVTALGAGSRSVLLVSSDETYRSSNGGRSFARLSANAGSSPGQLRYVAFASPSVVHGVSTDDRRIWTSTNAGVTWAAHRF